MKKRIILLLAILVICTGCLDKIAQKYQQKDIEEQEAIKEAGMPYVKKYIKNKYNFEFKESDIDKIEYKCTESVNFGCTGKSGVMEITAHHSGKKYRIIADSKNGDCLDDYEKDIVVDRIEAIFSNYLGIDKSKITIYIYETSFLRVEKVDTLGFDLNKLLPSYSKLDLFTYEELQESKVKNIIEKMKGMRISGFFYQAKDYNSYNNFLKEKSFNGDYYDGTYDYLRDSKNYLKGYYRYAEDLYDQTSYYRDYK